MRRIRFARVAVTPRRGQVVLAYREKRLMTEAVFDMSTVRDALVLTACCDLDIATWRDASLQLDGLLSRCALPVVLDVTDVFVGVAALRVLLDVVDRYGRTGRPVGIVGVSRGIERLLAELGLPPFPPSRRLRPPWRRRSRRDPDGRLLRSTAGERPAERGGGGGGGPLTLPSRLDPEPRFADSPVGHRTCLVLNPSLPRLPFPFHTESADGAGLVRWR